MLASLLEVFGPQPKKLRPSRGLVLLFSSFLAAALARQRFLHALLLARFQVKGVTFHFLNDVFLLNLTLEAAQSVFERFAFLQSDFCQRYYTPKLVLDELVSYCKIAA